MGRASGEPPLAVPVHRDRPDPRRVGGVLVGALVDPLAQAGIVESAVRRVPVGFGPATDRDRPRVAMMVGVAELGVGLEATEPREHLVPLPSCRPAREIGRLGAHGDPAVDARGAADAPSAQVRERASVARPDFFAPLDRPRVAAAEELDLLGQGVRVVRGAGLDEEDAVARVLGQARREHAARGPGADDDRVPTHDAPSCLRVWPVSIATRSVPVARSVRLVSEESAAERRVVHEDG